MPDYEQQIDDLKVRIERLERQKREALKKIEVLEKKLNDYDKMFVNYL